MPKIVSPKRLFLGSAAGLAALALLGGCAAVNQLTVEVSSFGSWPASRQAASYAFERLPSQHARADAQQQLEDAAKAALASAGFQPVAAGVTPDVLVQLGARVSQREASVWDDPLWWHGSLVPWRHRPWNGPYWGLRSRIDHPRYEREVALLLRDRASGAPLYEARASSQGFLGSMAGALRPLFDAALKDFPATGPNPRQVTVTLG